MVLGGGGVRRLGPAKTNTDTHFSSGLQIHVECAKCVKNYIGIPSRTTAYSHSDVTKIWILGALERWGKNRKGFSYLPGKGFKRGHNSLCKNPFFGKNEVVGAF